MTNEQLVEEYGRLAGHLAWDMVRRSATLGSEDAEDFASSAICRLIQCPPQYRDQPAYVKRILLNSVIKDWRKTLKMSEREISLEEFSQSEAEA